MTRRFLAFVFLTISIHAQTFDVASVKLSSEPVGPDYNNQVTVGPSTFSGKNVTLKGMIGWAYRLEPTQIFSGPKWFAETEYDVEAKADRAFSKEDLGKMLQSLLAARFHLATHRETRELKIFELFIDRNGPRIQPVKDGEGSRAPLGSRHFHGTMEQLVSLISIQLTIPAAMDDPSRPSIASGAPVPVFNRTGLSGIYDFDLEMKEEPGIPSFNLWQRVLQEQLGLKLESRKAQVEGIVVDSADRVPVAN